MGRSVRIYEVGTVVGRGFVVASPERPRRVSAGGVVKHLVVVTCPVCGSQVERLTSVMVRVNSCGCDHPRNKVNVAKAPASKPVSKVTQKAVAKSNVAYGSARRTEMMNQPISQAQRDVVAEANEAFGLDPMYAIEFAQEAHKLVESKPERRRGLV